MPSRYIGAHMPTSKGIGNAVRAGHAIGCTAVQVFTSSPQQWRGKEITDAIAEDLRTACGETGIQHVVSHDSYLINLASPDEELRQKSIAGLTAEIGRCAKLGIPSVVSHMGSWKGEVEDGLKRVAQAANLILAETDPSVTLCMETTAGQGSSLNSRFEEIARIIDLVCAHPRLGVCLDTCHIFAAGYDIRTREGYDLTMEGFGSMIGFDRLKAIHVNDSKKPLGSRVDRHAEIGDGEIGLEPFRWLVNDLRLADVPMVVETPDADTRHAHNVALLQSMVER